MLRFGEDLKGVAISAISSGRRIASVNDAVLDPNDLSIAALICTSRAGNETTILLVRDIFSFNSSTITIQNEDALSGAEDLVGLQNLLKINFKVVGKKVLTTSKKRVGSVREFVFDDQGFKIIKIHVQPPLTKIIRTSDLIISRTQIIEVNDSEIIVRDTSIKKPALFSAVADA